jgi:predicted ferric reductase
MTDGMDRRSVGKRALAALAGARHRELARSRFEDLQGCDPALTGKLHPMGRSTTGSLDVIRPTRTGVPAMHGCGRLGRMVLLALAVANLAVIIVLWLGGGGVSDVYSFADALSSGGRIAALWGAYLSLVAVLLLARVPVLERAVGFGRLTAWHGYAACGCLVMLLAHVGLTTAGLTVGDRTSLPTEASRLISEYPGVITATAGTLLLVVVAAMSARPVRRRLRYESWYFAHLYTYLAIGLAFSHQIATGQDFVGNAAARVYWVALYLVTLGMLVLFRVVRPITLAAAHRLRVARVIEEAPGVVSIEITGRRLDRLRAQPGQFFLWRFLTRDRWWQAHPFSLSAAPDEHRLRITVSAGGDFSTALRCIRPGTFVFAEGPLGAFTAAAGRRQQVALIASGAGITAIRALLESIKGDVKLLYRHTERDGNVLFRHELDELAGTRGVHVMYLTGEDRTLSSAVIKRLVPDIARRDVFVCGSPPMVVATRSSLIEAGCSRRHIFSERFGL